MKPITIEGANFELGAPQGWRNERFGVCEPLSVRIDELEDGLQLLVSAWSPDADELERLNAGAPVVLTIVGRSHPVVAISAGEIPTQIAAEKVLDVLESLLSACVAHNESNNRQMIDPHSERRAREVLRSFGRKV